MKMPNDADRWRLLEQSERALAGNLSPVEQADFNQLLRESPAARTLFAQALHQHAELKFDARLIKELAEEPANVAARPSPARWRNSAPTTLAVAAGVAIVLSVTALWTEGDRRNASSSRDVWIATVVKAKECKWAGSTLPTAEGSRVAKGTLELLEGIATVVFDSGAEVVMEAPATLELVDAMSCRLIRGTLMADVPHSAIGFTVDTPDAKVVDFGTRFGVSAGEDGKYLVKVLEGLVEVNPKATGVVRQLRRGQSVDHGLRKSQLSAPAAEMESRRWQPNLILDAGDGWQIVSSAYGKGKDTYVQGNSRAKNFGKDPYFRVKRSSLAPELNRKGYICFDVTRFKELHKDDAELVLSIEPSDLGFATLVPDSTFAVYGLTDESEDDWNENNLSLGETPARGEGYFPDPQKSVLLGRFQIAQGVSRGSRTLGGQTLVNFLRSDTNGLVTFVICRETDESARDGMAHAFATKESGSNTPPLLRLKTRPVSP